MEYLAHISEDRTRIQTALEHSQSVADLAGEFADKFGCRDWGYCAGMTHDLGKWTGGFQARLNNGKRVDHATAGAKELNAKGGYYSLLSYCVAGHHAGLPDKGTPADTSNQGTLCGRLKKNVEDCQDYKKEITIPDLSRPSIKPLQKGGFSVSFFLRMIYSCLVDSDFLDTENFMSEGRIKREIGDAMPVLLERLQHYVEKWIKNQEQDTVNGRRTEILRNCFEKGNDAQGLFRLTVPTGGGKTISSMAFAIQHAVRHGLDRVIYVIPFTSIIEQNAGIFRKIFGEENVLENHCNVEYDDETEFQPMQLAAENFDKRIVVTTNVQFFESLFARKSSRCRKIHNFANSVIIFDEAQMIPTEYLQPCVRVMAELIVNYHSSVVLCTATQPTLEKFFPVGIVCTELCPRMEEQFRFFKRNRLESLGEITEEDLINRLKNEKQALCILNNRKRVQKIYQRLEGRGVYALSTLIYPKNRKKILEEIRQCLDNGEKCILIATSLVEAGVDLDFQNVYREIAGVDSIIQAAGRGNREGRRPAEESHIFVIKLKEKMGISYELRQPMELAAQIEREYEDISALDAVQEYFTRLHEHKGDALDKKRIIDVFEEGGRTASYPFAAVAKDFQLIQNTTKCVLIAEEEEAKELAARLRSGERSKELMRRAGQYCINLYQNTYLQLLNAGILEAIDEEMSILAVEDHYSEKTGLLTEAETGEALWL